MHKLAVHFWSIVFIAIGLAIFAHKVFQLGMPVTPDATTETWTVQARLVFTGNGKNIKASMSIPNLTPGYIKINEHYISGDFGLNAKVKGDNKTAEWAKRKANGQQTLYYRATLTKSKVATKWTEVPKYPEAPEFFEPYSTAVDKIIEDVRSQSADTASFTYELITQLRSSDENENISLIKDLARTDEQFASLITKLLAVAHIPTRKLWAVELADAANDVLPQIMVQTYNGEGWLTFNPKTGVSGIPANHLIWKIGDDPLYTLKGGESAEIKFSVTKSYIELLEVAKLAAKEKGSILGKFTLFSLPVHSQNTFSLILMVPLGALIVVFMRTFIGVQTFGTFMPILIAVAFRETQLLWGIVLFTVIVFIGLLIRLYLERLRLLLIPRLAAILVIVVMLMLLISFTTSQLGLDRLLSISLFPMVILAMTIERMSITWEESGGQTALIQGLGSLLVACLGYLVMTNQHLNYLMFAFPEFLIVILGICIWMGRYTGYRVSELFRFREIKTSV
ncbi:MAG: inactive transglutaminase family protein [Gammaproteobacteria bacterium]|nr:inactive transglutaminase family protein [Gammaproteobacteria bacterium]